MTDATTTSPSAKRISIFDLIETDLNAEEDGRWFYDIWGTRDETDPETNPGVDVKLRRTTSRAAQKARERIQKELRSIQRKGALPPEVKAKFDAQVLAEAVILDWKGMFDRDGHSIEFSPSAALDLLTKYPNWRNAIAGMAGDLDNFRAERAEAIAGN